MEASPTQIMPDVMSDAIRFMREYALPNAERLEHVVTPGEIEGDARALMALILEKGWQRFHITDIKRYGPARIKVPVQRNDALDVLEKAGLIRRDFQREGDTRGRQREEYDVNPMILRPAGS
ncbi:hypothetical protein ADL19_10015 [Streptomyces purpurogeneiscleroticus]|nr:hypothetical protein ADL19_10015 [Streptomyces purpurogeneiscleroticus]